MWTISDSPLLAPLDVNILCLSANRTAATNCVCAPNREAPVSVIETRKLRKEYGKIQALKGVSLTVEKGQIYGLLGQNGAGKTTLIKILLGTVRITDGEAELLGAPAGTTG